MPIAAPEAAIGVNAVQLASGVGVDPVRTLIEMAVPAGVSANHDMFAHVVFAPVPKTRDVNVPLAAYGVMRIQLIEMVAPPGAPSLAIGSMGVVKPLTAWEANWTPSTQNVTAEPVQSIRYR